MRAVQFQVGDASNMTVGEVPRPSLKENQIMIKVHSSAVNRADTLQVCVSHYHILSLNTRSGFWVIRLLLCCGAPTVLSGVHCTIRSPLYCWDPTVLLGSHCTAGVPLYCCVPTVLLGSHCTIGVTLYCWASTVLLWSRCTIGVSLYCRAPAVSVSSSQYFHLLTLLNRPQAWETC